MHGLLLTLSVIGVGSAMRLADRPPPGVVMRVFSRSYLSNGRAIGMVVIGYGAGDFL